MPPRPDAAPGWTPPDAGAAGAATVAFASATGGPPSGGEPTGAGEPAPATSPAGAQDAGWTPPPAAPAGWTPPPGEGGWAPPPGTAGGSAPGGDAWMAADAAYATRRAERRARRRHDERIVGLVFGLLLILVGVWFLLREYLPDIDFDRFWPLIIIGIGVVLLVAAFAGSRGSRDGGATG